MNSPEIDERISRYLNEEMTSEEMDLFEDTLKRDKSLQHAFKVEALTRYTLKQMYHEEKELKEIISEISTEPAKVLPLWQKPGFLIGVVAAILMLLVLVFYPQTDPRNQIDTWLSSNFDQFDFANPESNLKGDATRDSSLITDAYNAYARKDYNVAILAFRKLHEIAPENTQHRFFLAFCHFRIEQYEQAIDLLRDWPSEDKTYNDKAEFLLVGALLRKNKKIKPRDLTETQSILERIQSDPEHLYQDDAAHILEILTRLSS